MRRWPFVKTPQFQAIAQACQMFGLNPAGELGIVDETAALAVTLAAWGVNKREELRAKIALRRELDRELAIMLAAAGKGLPIPDFREIEPAKPDPRLASHFEARDAGRCRFGGCGHCVYINGEFKGCRATGGVDLSDLFVESVPVEDGESEDAGKIRNMITG